MSERLYSIRTEWGDFSAGFTDGGLSRFEFPRGGSGRRRPLPELAPGDEPAAAGLLADLGRYFAGEPVQFRAPLDLSAGNQRVLLHRARSHVRAALERHLDG